MTLGELFLKSLSSGVITQGEVDWLASHQHAFSRHEEAAAIRLGRLMDEGVVNLGCRLTPQWLHHCDVLEHWIEPLGRRRHAVRHQFRSDPSGLIPLPHAFLEPANTSLAHQARRGQHQHRNSHQQKREQELRQGANRQKSSGQDDLRYMPVRQWLGRVSSSA